MTTDTETLNVYDQRASDYAQMAVDPNQSKSLAAFIQAMPKDAHVLDYGCGPGHCAKTMLGHDLTVDAFDASPEMIGLARKIDGLNLRQMSFEDMNAKTLYHGIWANFSLLHASKSSFPHLLKAIRDALISGGLLSLALKIGTGESRDSIGRFYAYYSKDELIQHLTDVGFTVANITLGKSVGLAGKNDPYIVITANA